jgi:hypothetical protein
LKLPNQQACPISVGSFVDRTADLAPAVGGPINQVTAIVQDNRGEILIVKRFNTVYKVIPNLNIMEVSGPSAAPLMMSSPGSWSWENLGNSVEHTFGLYKIYRSITGPQGPFNCIGRIQASTCTGSCTWTGDPTVPNANEVFYYLITATGANQPPTNQAGETTAGAQSDGTLRVVNTAGGCQL